MKNDTSAVATLTRFAEQKKALYGELSTLLTEPEWKEAEALFAARSDEEIQRFFRRQMTDILGLLRLGRDDRPHHLLMLPHEEKLLLVVVARQVCVDIGFVLAALVHPALSSRSPVGDAVAFVAQVLSDRKFRWMGGS